MALHYPELDPPMTDRTVDDVIRELQEPAGQFGKSMVLCVEAASLLAINEHAYQQICLKNDALQALVGKMTDAMLASGKEQGRLREALQRLLDWNEGIAAGRGNHYPREHADVARAALAEKQSSAV